MKYTANKPLLRLSLIRPFNIIAVSKYTMKYDLREVLFSTQHENKYMMKYSLTFLYSISFCRCCTASDFIVPVDFDLK